MWRPSKAGEGASPWKPLPARCAFGCWDAPVVRRLVRARSGAICAASEHAGRDGEIRLHSSRRAVCAIRTAAGFQASCDLATSRCFLIASTRAAVLPACCETQNASHVVRCDRQIPDRSGARKSRRRSRRAQEERRFARPHRSRQALSRRPALCHGPVAIRPTRWDALEISGDFRVVVIPACGLRLGSRDGWPVFRWWRAMKIPVVRGVIDRRILVNYHVDPSVLAPLLPAPFRPKITHGVGMVGICLIRLKKVRPTVLPSWLGISSENAAHRTAVEWDDNGTFVKGSMSGGATPTPGSTRWLAVGSSQAFTTTPSSSSRSRRIALKSRFAAMTASPHVGTRSSGGPIAGVLGVPLARRSSAFFQAGSLGYSATPDPSRFQGLELRVPTGGSSRWRSRRCVPVSSRTCRCSRRARSNSIVPC